MGVIYGVSEQESVSFFLGYFIFFLRVCVLRFCGFFKMGVIYGVSEQERAALEESYDPTYTGGLLFFPFFVALEES